MTRGQFLERPTLISVGEQVLEGLSHRGGRAPALLVLPPDPSLGGDMQHVVAAEVVWAASQAGHASLRFNHRGVGASQGRRGNEATRLEDAQAALLLLLDNCGASSAVVAALPGASPLAVSLAACTSAVRALALISPPGFAAPELLSLQRPVRMILGALDGMRPSSAVMAALARFGGSVVFVENADRHFVQGLPQIGRAVKELLADVHP